MNDDLNSATTVEQLRESILASKDEWAPENYAVVGASYICQTTKFTPPATTYLNYYLLVRIGEQFGVCVHDPGQLEMDIVTELAGTTLDQALNDKRLPVRIALMDAYLGQRFPHARHCTRSFTIDAGAALPRARQRDGLIAELADIEPGRKVALIGVVNPLIEAITARGAECLPCDLHLAEAALGLPIERDMEKVLERADSVICTAMTLGNGTFDRILTRVNEKKIPLTVFAQTGSAVAARFVGKGLTCLLAETFPFSQFSGGDTQVFYYKAS